MPNFNFPASSVQPILDALKGRQEQQLLQRVLTGQATPEETAKLMATNPQMMVNAARAKALQDKAERERQKQEAINALGARLQPQVIPGTPPTMPTFNIPQNTIQTGVMEALKGKPIPFPTAEQAIVPGTPGTPAQTVYPTPEETANVQALAALYGGTPQYIMPAVRELSEIDLTRAKIETEIADARSKVATGDLTYAEIEKVYEDIKRLAADTYRLRQLGDVAKAEAFDKDTTNKLLPEFLELKREFETWKVAGAKADVGKTTAETEKLGAETETERARKGKVGAETETERAQRGKVEAETRNIGSGGGATASQKAKNNRTVMALSSPDEILMEGSPEAVVRAYGGDPKDPEVAEALRRARRGQGQGLSGGFDKNDPLGIR